MTETPPRAWGRLNRRRMAGTHLGNTPTGVGKTLRKALRTEAGRKHPHGRGEDQRHQLFEAIELETPPRAWGRQPLDKAQEPLEGNTPTGVGKTFGCDSGVVRLSETPPRAWGRLVEQLGSEVELRNTPTGVGKTLHTVNRPSLRRKHPHGRGEDSGTSSAPENPKETPPRAWGRPRGIGWEVEGFRNTPTGVGKTSWSYSSSTRM